MVYFLIKIQIYPTFYQKKKSIFPLKLYVHIIDYDTVYFWRTILNLIHIIIVKWKDIHIKIWILRNKITRLIKMIVLYILLFHN